MNSKKGASHVEAIISFIIFVGFLVFLFSIFNPLKKPVNPSLADTVFSNLEDNLTTSLTRVSISVKDGKLATSDSCFSIENIGDFSCGGEGKLIVKNKSGDIVGSAINKEDNKIYIEKINPDNEQFYTIYCSDELENPKELSPSGGRLIVPYFGTIYNIYNGQYEKLTNGISVGKDTTYSDFPTPKDRDYEGFIEFDISQIRDDLAIDSVKLSLTVALARECSDPTETDLKLTFSRFPGKRVSTYTDDAALWDDISTGYNNLGYYASNLPEYITPGEKILDLRQQGIEDLRSQLPSDFFSIGIFADSGIGSQDECIHDINFNTDFSSANYPKLIVNGQLWDTTEGSCKALSEGDYVLGIINNRNIWSEKKLTNFKGEYKNKYSEIKDFFIQKTNDFGFIIKEVETEKTLFDGQRNIPRGVNVYAETTPIDILDKNANITGSSINVIVW